MNENFIEFVIREMIIIIKYIYKTEFKWSAVSREREFKFFNGGGGEN